MACYSVTKYGFTTVTSLMSDIDLELTTPHSGVTYFVKATTQTSGTGNILLYKTTANVDPLSDYINANISPISYGWRLGFWMHDLYRVTAHAGTELQYPDNVTFTTVAYASNRAYVGTPSYREPPGSMNTSVWSDTKTVAGTVYPVPMDNNFDEVWLNRDPTQNLSVNAYPMNYTLTMTNRGVFLTVWEDNQEEVPTDPSPTTGFTNLEKVYGNSPIRWLLVQRPVDRITGNVRGGSAMRGNVNPAVETSRCPVFALFGTGQPNQYKKFVVRENDVLTPSAKKPAAVATEDSPALINPYQQQSITETGEFVVTFVNNLSTARYRYGDELDMLGTVGAEVIGPGTTINVTVYGESINSRQYTALYSNKQYGTGMRLMVLTKASAAEESARD